MNKIQYDQAGGFPLTTNRLTNMQEAFAPLINGLGIMAGNLAIISGCSESANMVSNGVVQVGDEIFEFKSGIKQTYVTLFEEKIAAEFENGQAKAVLIKRYITFGSGTQNYKWEDFKRVPILTELGETIKQMQQEIKILKAQNQPLTQGDEIRFFNNYAYLIPPGYVELPENEWKGRMIINIDRSDPNFNEVGKTGGNKTHTQSENEVAPHVHRVGGQDNSAQPRGSSSNEVANVEDYGTSADYFHRKTSTNLVGNTVITTPQPMDIMNPYRVVLFIKWIGLP